MVLPFAIHMQSSSPVSTSTLPESLHHPPSLGRCSAMSSSPSLSQRINTSTRPLHTHLNALILSLLPLALPPHASDAGLYTIGISQISPIYEAFEEELKLLLAQVEDDGGGREDRGVNNSSDGEYRQPQDARATLISASRSLHLPELERSNRLRQDISKLQREVPHATTSIDSKKMALRLIAFTAHIHTTLSTHPHLLLAYTWVLYMALFSGGRYIRAKLLQAGPKFWNRASGEKGRGDVDDVLTFWTFDSDEDGEDIKAVFKTRFAEVENHLTEAEREEVVQEAVHIMEAVHGVIEEIAAFIDRGEQAGLTAIKNARKTGDGTLEDCKLEAQKADESSIQWLLLKHILPMGMMELMSGAANVVVLGIGSSFKAVGLRKT